MNGQFTGKINMSLNNFLQKICNKLEEFVFVDRWDETNPATGNCLYHLYSTTFNDEIKSYSEEKSYEIEKKLRNLCFQDEFEEWLNIELKINKKVLSKNLGIGDSQTCNYRTVEDFKQEVNIEQASLIIKQIIKDAGN